MSEYSIGVLPHDNHYIILSWISWERRPTRTD